MTKWQRVKTFFSGLILIATSAGLIYLGEEGYSLVAAILGLSLTISGLKMIIYYLAMARHMVGGSEILIRGLILFDLGTYSSSLMFRSTLYIVMYLMVIHAFSGGVSILNAVQGRQLDAPSWKLLMSSGIINILISVSCFIFIGSPQMLVYIYSAGLLWSAFGTIAASLKKTAIVYIQ